MKSTKFLSTALVAGLLSITALSRADSLLERIATTVLAEKFGIDTREVIVLREQTSLPVYELAPIYEGAHYFKQKPSTVWQLRQQGLGWGEIAHRVGMHPGTFNKLRKQGVFDRDRFWTTSYSDRFDVPVQRVEVLRKSGGTLEDVLGAILVGKLSNKDPRQVYDQFKTQRSWVNVTNNYNVRLEDWHRVSAPVRTRYGTPVPVAKHKSNNGVRDHGAGVGKGKSKGKDIKAHGKGNGSGKGIAKSKGEGHGQGTGKSKVKEKGGKGGGKGKGGK